MDCKNCGNVFEPKNKRQVHCSKECKDKWKRKNAIRKPKMHIAYTCKFCNKEYHPKEVDRKTYCSRECAFEDKKAKPKVKTKLICVVCGKKFDGRSSKRYCSDECIKTHQRNEYLRYKATEQYRLNLTKQRNNYIPITQAPIKKICIQCNKKFETTNTRKEHCSDKCAGALHKGNVSKARRTRVFKRDNYKCQICGKKMKMDKSDTLGTKRPHLLAPTIDHITPVSIAKQLGWTNIEIHKESNLQSAHLICNINKSNKAMNDQLRIW